MARIDRFKTVLLDFADVAMIGQSFADEVFRVFASKHPDVELTPINTTPEVAQMISRAKARRADDIRQLESGGKDSNQ